MKKVTLSAAILALSMMGCSDAGLDNSVASAPASEVKSEQTHNFLARNFYQDFHQGLGIYRFSGGVINVNTYEEGNHGAGAFAFSGGPLPSVVNVLTVAVAYCEYDPNDHKYGYSCAKHSAGFQSGATDKSIDPRNPDHSSGRDVKAITGSLENVPMGGLGVVSSIAAVFDQGTPTEDIWGVSLYSGPLTYNTAMKVYQKYLLQAAENMANNRCLNWMPDDDECFERWH